MSAISISQAESCPARQQPSRAPRHPADILTGCRVVVSREGRAVAQMPVPESPSGEGVPLGWLGALADVATAQALAGSVAKGFGIRTVNLRMDAVGEIPRPGETATGRGELLGLDAQSGVSRATLHGPDGKIFALCTARFIVVPGETATLTPAAAEQQPGEAKPGTISEALKTADFHAGGGTSRFTLAPSVGMGNQFGMVHGGFHVSMADLAMRSAAQTLVPPNSLELLDLAVTYHRPISIADERLLNLRGTVQRQGRRILAVTGDMETESNRLLTSAQATFLVRESATSSDSDRECLSQD